MQYASAYHACQAEDLGIYGAAYKLCRQKQVIRLSLWFATHAGAEKITTVQEAADLISQQIKQTFHPSIDQLLHPSSLREEWQDVS